MPALEKDIEKAVCAYAKKLGCLVYKFVSPGQRGVPDRMIILPFGTVVFIEFKTPQGKLSPIQEREIAKLREKGIRTHVVNNAETGKRLLDSLTYFVKPENEI